jgi:hypothetical protein
MSDNKQGQSSEQSQAQPQPQPKPEQTVQQTKLTFDAQDRGTLQCGKNPNSIAEINSDEDS